MLLKELGIVSYAPAQARGEAVSQSLSGWDGIFHAESKSGRGPRGAIHGPWRFSLAPGGYSSALRRAGRKRIG